MREQFEKLPAIKRAMKDGSVEWDDEEGCYGGDDDYCSGYVNGARYTYQEQQKKLQSIYDGCTELTTASELLDSIKELLK